MKGIFIFLISTSLVSASQIAELKCWTRRDQTHYTGLGLGRSQNINDRIQCIKKCRESDGCGAVDIDSATNPNCWYQMNFNFIATAADLKPFATATNYLYNSACGKNIEGVDVNCWHVTSGHHFPGLDKINVDTVNGCLKACMDRKDCNVVDWDLKPSPSCWIQTKPLEVSVEKIKPLGSCTNFILLKDCVQLTGGIDMTYWRVSHLSCYPSPGLVQVDRPNLKSCLEYCQSNKDCNMVDYDPPTKPPCWAQTKPFDILRGKLVDSKTCSNYYLLRDKYEKSLQAESATTAEMQCWYYKNDTDYTGPGKSPEPSAKTLTKCLKKCHADSSCVGATYTSGAGEPCALIRLKEKLDHDDLDDKKGVTMFVPNKSCKDWKANN